MTAKERARALVEAAFYESRIGMVDDRFVDAITAKVEPIVQALMDIARNDEDCDADNAHLVTSRRALAGLARAAATPGTLTVKT